MKATKMIATASAFALIAINVAFAATTLTGSVTGGLVNTDATGNIPGAVVGSSTVGVSATVAPTLTMALSKSNLDLSALKTDGTTYNTDSITVTGATNAINGMTITMGSLGLSYSGQYLGAHGAAGTATADTADGYKFTTASWPTGIADVTTATPNAVYTTAAPVAPVATTVTVGAVAGPTTPAGSYTDTLTFTVTGNF